MNNPAFNGDNYIKEEFEKLVEKFFIKTIVETGTYKADTTAELINMVPNVYSIELNVKYFTDVQKSICGNLNRVKFMNGSSPVVIEKIINEGIEQPVLFFLDAHWYNFNPLVDELKMLAKYKMSNNVIAIHDFKVPGKDFGYDKFPDGTDYCWEAISEYIHNIYGDNFVFYYNEIAAGANRGIVYICPSPVTKE